MGKIMPGVSRVRQPKRYAIPEPCFDLPRCNICVFLEKARERKRPLRDCALNFGREEACARTNGVVVSQYHTYFPGSLRLLGLEG